MSAIILTKEMILQEIERLNGIVQRHIHPEEDVKMNENLVYNNPNTKFELSIPCADGLLDCTHYRQVLYSTEKLIHDTKEMVMRIVVLKTAKYNFNKGIMILDLPEYHSFNDFGSECMLWAIRATINTFDLPVITVLYDTRTQKFAERVRSLMNQTEVHVIDKLYHPEEYWSINGRC